MSLRSRWHEKNKNNNKRMSSNPSNSILLDSLISSDHRKSNDMKKLDSSGQYLPFEGLTVIMPLETDLSSMHQDLVKVVPAQVHALLPFESYHVTLTGIRCRFHFKTCEKYNEFLKEKHGALEELKKDLLLGNERAEQEETNLKFVLEHDVSDTEMKQITAHLKPADLSTSQYLDTVTHHCQKHLGPKLFRRSQSHLSMAYKVPNSDELSESQRIAIARVVNSHLKGREISFGKAHVCKFNDMRSFTPI